MKKILHFLKKGFTKETLRYYGVGAIATAIDWSSFALLATEWHLHYLFSVLVAYSMGSITNYSFNKRVTFKCKSRKIARQMTVFLIATLFLLSWNMALMSIMIKSWGWGDMISRIVTTGLLVYPGYLLHRSTTFNKRLFKQANDGIINVATPIVVENIKSKH